MAKRSRNSPKKHETKPGVFVDSSYCYKCGETKSPLNFSVATDYYLSYNGLFQYCKDCVDDIYAEILKKERTVEKSILVSCRVLNIPFNEEILKDVVIGDFKGSPLSYYLGRIKQASRNRDKFASYPTMEMTFSEEVLEKYKIKLDDDKTSPHEFWGDGAYDNEEVKYLDNQYNLFKETISVENHSEVYLLKRIAKKALEIRRAEFEQDRKAVASLEKEMLGLMKSMATSPDIIQKSRSGKQKQSIGNLIRMIETSRPAEWMEGEGRELYEDYMNIDKNYVHSYIRRPIKNLITGEADLNVIDKDGNIVPPPF